MARAALARALSANGDGAEAVSMARAAVEAFEADLALGEEEPLARLALVEALAENGEHAEARAALARARERLLERAQRITDPGLRDAYLERVPHHARTLALYQRWFSSTEQ
jgi:tetratricopeptide (TPR) repeat protein